MQVTEVTATATVKATAAMVKLVVLSPGSTASSVILKDGGAGGAVRLTLVAASGTSSVPMNIPDGIPFTTDVHATLAGTGALAYVGY